MQLVFKFDGKISRDFRTLFILPENNILFSYSLFAVRSFVNYFSKSQHIFYPVDGKVFLLNYLFRNQLHWFKVKKEKQLKKMVEYEKNLDLIINLDIENSSRYDFALDRQYLAISFSPLKYATVSFIPSSSLADRIFTNFPCSLGIPFEEFKLNITSDEKAKARDFIKYKGHSEKNVLVVCDVLDTKKEIWIREYLAQVTRDKLTFIGQDALKTVNPDLIVPLISLADLFISEDSIYTFIAQVLSIKTYLFKGKGKFLPSPAPRLLVEKGDFRKEILLLIPTKK
ncbi:MAG: hypothetical protein ACPLN0_04405 [Candidatus Hydrothermia bacterium]